MQIDTPRRTAEAADAGLDLLEMLQKLWEGRRLIVRGYLAGALAGLVIAFSIPREYTTTVKLAPEIQAGRPNLGGLSSLASMAGIQTGSLNTADAVSPELYPDIVQSVPFLTALFDVRLTSADGEKSWTVEEYVSEELRLPWWERLLGLPFRLLGGIRNLFATEEPHPAGSGTDPFRLTRAEDEAVRTLRERIAAGVDRKTLVVSLRVTMQDPLVSATLTDTVMRNLQEFITQYRTDKARNDLAFTQRLHDEARDNYYEAQQRYARYMDQNQGIVRRSCLTEQERLQNEMNLAFNLYNQTAQQLQLARAKVQESTPVYAVVQPATVPLRPSKPSKIILLAGCIFLGGVVSSGWIFVREKRPGRRHDRSNT